MSFAAQTKKELTMVEAGNCCNRAELAALTQMNGTQHMMRDRLVLDISTQNAAIARRIYILLKHQFTSLHTEIIVRKQMRLKKNNLYIIRIPNQVQAVLTRLAIAAERGQFSQHVPTQILEADCCRRAYLRGAFLAAGSVNNPEGSSYHLEIATNSAEHCTQLCELANMYDLNARDIERKNSYVLYLKEGERIIGLLNLIGAHQALFKFEDVRILRDMRNSVNRIVNCETANLNKTINAAVRQIENIKFIREEIGLEQLPEKLQEVALVRLEHPELNLKEVGELLKGSVSKSGVNHRLRKIDELADKLRKSYS